VFEEGVRPFTLAIELRRPGAAEEGKHKRRGGGAGGACLFMAGAPMPHALFHACRNLSPEFE
jgi:hypothetical protein